MESPLTGQSDNIPENREIGCLATDDTVCKRQLLEGILAPNKVCLVVGAKSKFLDTEEIDGVEKMDRKGRKSSEKRVRFNEVLDFYEEPASPFSALDDGSADFAGSLPTHPLRSIVRGRLKRDDNAGGDCCINVEDFQERYNQLNKGTSVYRRQRRKNLSKKQSFGDFIGSQDFTAPLATMEEMDSFSDDSPEVAFKDFEEEEEEEDQLSSPLPPPESASSFLLTRDECLSGHEDGAVEGATEDNAIEDNAIKDNAIEDNAIEDNAIKDNAIEENNAIEDNAAVECMASVLRVTDEGQRLLLREDFINHIIGPTTVEDNVAVKSDCLTEERWMIDGEVAEGGGRTVGLPEEADETPASSATIAADGDIIDIGGDVAVDDSVSADEALGPCEAGGHIDDANAFQPSNDTREETSTAGREDMRREENGQTVAIDPFAIGPDQLFMIRETAAGAEKLMEEGNQDAAAAPGECLARNRTVEELIVSGDIVAPESKVPEDDLKILESKVPVEITVYVCRVREPDELNRSWLHPQESVTTDNITVPVILTEMNMTEVPDTEVLVAEVPDTIGRDAEVPGAEVPDTEVPDAEVPDAQVPDAQVPDTEGRDAEVPDAEIPDAEVPDAEVPDTIGRDAEVPGAKVPDTEGTDAEVPDAEVPDAEVPDKIGRDAEVPGAKVPDTEGTDAEVPDAEVPDTEVPDAEVPDTEVPDAEVPDAEVPDAEVPYAESPLLQDGLFVTDVAKEMGDDGHLIMTEGPSDQMMSKAAGNKFRQRDTEEETASHEEETKRTAEEDNRREEDDHRVTRKKERETSAANDDDEEEYIKPPSLTEDDVEMRSTIELAIREFPAIGDGLLVGDDSRSISLPENSRDGSTSVSSMHSSVMDSVAGGGLLISSGPPPSGGDGSSMYLQLCNAEVPVPVGSVSDSHVSCDSVAVAAAAAHRSDSETSFRRSSNSRDSAVMHFTFVLIPNLVWSFHSDAPPFWEMERGHNMGSQIPTGERRRCSAGVANLRAARLAREDGEGVGVVRKMRPRSGCN